MAQTHGKKFFWTVYEVDTLKESTPDIPVFESFHNPHPALRFIRLKNRGGRHEYAIEKQEVKA